MSYRFDSTCTRADWILLSACPHKSQKLSLARHAPKTLSLFSQEPRRADIGCINSPVGVSWMGSTPGSILASLDIAAAIEAVLSQGEVGLKRRKRNMTRGLSGC